MTFDGKSIVLTGGSGGIGRIVASYLTAKGAKITSLSRREDVAAGSTHIRVDFSARDGIAAAQGLVTQLAPHILINLAGVQHFGLFEHQSLESLHQHYLINLIAPVALCQAAVPQMKRRRSGHIVNIGSVFGSIPFAHFVAYSSAKAGLKAFSESLRREVRDTGIAVTHISPRAVRTNFITPNLQKYADITHMNIDRPTDVAWQIVRAIERKRKDVHIGFPERIFARMNAVLPGLIDAAVARNDRKARQLFSNVNQEDNDGKS
jgi:short-subunit dehydrogenase